MEQLRILIPPDNFNERSYIVDVIINQFLGLSYDLVISEDAVDYSLQLNNKLLIIKDSFFNKYKEPLSYLRAENLPGAISWFGPTQMNSEKIPIIYGEDGIITENIKITVGLDIFASSFFMLSRWEELVMDKKDKFGRCNEPDMFVVRNNLYARPIVNEYCFFLRELLSFLYVKLPPVPNKFGVLVTHDIDFLFRFGSLSSLSQNLAGDIINRKSLLTAGRTLLKYLQYKRGKEKDPFDTFDELMDMSEKYGVKSSFYFKPSVKSESDSTYSITDDRVVRIMKNINQRGHEVGFHPSINTFHNAKQFKKEINRLRSVGIPIYGGRQHFLLYDVSETFSLWEDEGLLYDSGMGFSGRFGFRCGVCWPFRIFDVTKRKNLKIIQKPLLVMDAALIPFNPGPEEFFQKISGILDQVRTYSGIFVLLWHNDGFNRPENEKYRFIYEKVLQSFD